MNRARKKNTKYVYVVRRVLISSVGITTDLRAPTHRADGKRGAADWALTVKESVLIGCSAQEIGEREENRQQRGKVLRA